jgi:hypothetical protein
MRDNGIPEPSKRWWLQRSFILTEGLGVLFLAAGIFVAISRWSDYARGLIGGALFGVAGTLIIGSAFTVHDQWEQLNRDYQIWTESSRVNLEPKARAINAYYLGVLSRTFPVSPVDLPSRIAPLRYFCRYLQLAFTAAEYELLYSAHLTLSEAVEISEFIRLKFERDVPAELWSFFKLGRLIGLLTAYIESMRPIEATSTAIGSLAENRFIRVDRDFANPVTSILELTTTFDEINSDRARLKRDLDLILRDLPGPIIEPFEISEGSTELKWIWIDDDGHMRPGGKTDGYVIIAVGDWSYSINRRDKDYLSEVNRVDMKWECSQHPGADSDAPCLDIKLIFDHTDGGIPVTEASLTLVRWTDDGQLETLEV